MSAGKDPASGYPHLEECERFAHDVLCRIKTCRLAVKQIRSNPPPRTRKTIAINSPTPSTQRWYQGITRYQWLVLIIASLGWIFDVYEGQVFVATMKEMMDELVGASVSDGDKSFYKNVLLASFLLGGSLGGVVFGVVSDKIGRTRTMILTILVYSCFTCVSALAQNWWQMAILRFLVAMGVGGEWAVASAMVAEVFPKRARAWSGAIFHASSVLGVFLAAGAGMLVGIGISWRVCFVLGALPALLTLWIRYRLREPDQWIEAREAAKTDPAKKTGNLIELFSAGIRLNTFVGVSLATIGLATMWGVHINGRNVLRQSAERRVASDIAATTDDQLRERLVGESTAMIKNAEMLGMFLIASGAGVGLLMFGPLSERLGRRGAFLFYHLGGAGIAVALFQTFYHSTEQVLYLVLPIFGFLTLGMHAGYAVYFPELFPTRLRGTGTGFCFNGGRIIAAPILVLIGFMHTKEWGYSPQETATGFSGLFLLAILVLLIAPETKGRELPE